MRSVTSDRAVIELILERLEPRQLLTGTITPTLTISAGNSVSEGTTLNQDVGAFSDSVPEATGNYIAQVNWGDGTTTFGTPNRHTGDPIQTVYVAGQHTFGKPGAFPITITLWDGPVGGGATSSGTSVSPALTITPVNDPPTITNDGESTIYEDSGPHGFSYGGLLANDIPGPVGESDEDAQTLVVTSISNVTGGFAFLDPSSGSVVFTPAADFHGTAGFDYTARDNGLTNGVADFKSGTAHVSFAVAEVNDPPVAGNDLLSAVAEDSGTRHIALSTLLSNDSPGAADEAGQPLTVLAISSVVGGTASIVGNEVRFTPDPNFNGLASFNYIVQDQGTTNGILNIQSDVGTVVFVVTPVNDVPRFNKGANQSANAATAAFSMSNWATSINAGPSDESNQALDFIVGVDNPSLFSVQPAISPNGTLSFTAAANQTGIATVTVRLHDNGGTAGGGVDTSAPLTFTITIDTQAPRLAGTPLFNFQTEQSLAFTFSENVGPSLSEFDFVVENLTKGSKVDPKETSLQYSSDVATLVFKSIPLGDGNYRASLSKNDVADAAGNPLADDVTFDFFVYSGDANHDRAVDVTDLGLLATHWNQTGTWGDGDFNYDGTVDVTDLGVLATHWGTTLAPATLASTSAKARPFASTRLIADVNLD